MTPFDRIVLWVLAVGPTVVAWIFKFKNPDMTDTRFVMTYWTFLLPLYSVSFLAFWLLERQHRGRKRR